MTLAPFFSRQRRGGGQLAAPAYRWDPRREMDEINSRFGQLMQTFLGETAAMSGGGGWAPLTPPIDVEETEDAYAVDVDLPNVDPQDISLEMRGEELRISGAFQQQSRGGIVRRQNRQQGEFEYMIDLPSDIDADRVEAKYANGVLTVSVGKTKDQQPRRIEIRGGQAKQQLGDRQQNAQQQTGSREGTQQRAAQESAAQESAARQGSAQEAQSAKQREGKDDRTSGR
jgi:HSP20 family protein